MNDKRNDSDGSVYGALALVGQVGLSIALPTVFGAFLGRFIDGALHDSAPIATILGLLFGLAAGVSLVVRAVSRLPK